MKNPHSDRAKIEKLEDAIKRLKARNKKLTAEVKQLKQDMEKSSDD